MILARLIEDLDSKFATESSLYNSIHNRKDQEVQGRSREKNHTGRN